MQNPGQLSVQFNKKRLAAHMKKAAAKKKAKKKTAKRKSSKKR
jgi:hypothetical protein